jgi:hypothetical protein
LNRFAHEALDRGGKRGDHPGNVKRAIVLPTLPSFPAVEIGGQDRVALLAGLTFVEGAIGGWGLSDLVEWFNTHGELLGRKAPPPMVTDAVVGSIALTPNAKLSGDKIARPDDIAKLLAMTRWRVILTLRGLLANPCDDRFLQAAIFAGRVQRRKSEWHAHPRDTDLLSDVVLSLFVVDVLSFRDFHEQNLCVCDVCGRISYNPRVTTRTGCADHVPRTDTTSGVQGKSHDDD